WSLDELKGRRIPFMPESEREDSMKLIMEVIYNGIPCQGFETTRLTKDGQLLNISLSASRYCDQQNQPVGMLVILRDVTARLQAEGLLRDREAKLQTILQSAPTGIGISANRVFQEVNPQFCKMLGYTEQELLGQNARMVYPSDEEYEKVGRELQKFIRKYGMSTIETYFCHKDGKTIDVLLSFKPLIEDNLSAAIIFNALDITEIKKLEGQLYQSRKMESIGTLAGGIAHDFNNILTAITGYAQMSMMNLTDSTKIKHNVEQIQKAADRAANLTRQMLGFSRKQMVIPQVIDINKLIVEMEKMLKRLLREDIKFTISLNKQAGTIYADPSQLEQVIMNLVVNAQDAFIGHAGKAEKTIKISTSQVSLDEEYAAIHEGSSTGLHLLLQVEDNGCGMTKQVSKRIFEPFYTTKDVGKGTGMGLATVYGIVKQNQGSIYVYSEPGRGSTFKIYWPIIAAEKATKVEKQKDLQPKGGSEVILLAEDDAQIRETSCCQLREAGYTILEAENGLKALEAAIKHQGKIDLLFTDIVMPLMGGKDLSKKVKKIHPEITIFYASGHMEETVQQEITDLDQDHFINKPYNINDIMIRIRQLLNKKES
ncbi:MAG: PAS domain S-box protein, partial [Pseudomonadota bacterium]|nr:PAS domain S-box protein [Pseudomonadota bacterium]